MASGEAFVTGLPKTSIAPPRAGSSPTATFMQVDLPAPLRPRRPKSRPSPSANEILCSTWLSP